MGSVDVECGVAWPRPLTQISHQLLKGKWVLECCSFSAALGAWGALIPTEACASTILDPSSSDLRSWRPSPLASASGASLALFAAGSSTAFSTTFSSMSSLGLTGPIFWFMALSPAPQKGPHSLRPCLQATLEPTTVRRTRFSSCESGSLACILPQLFG